MRILFVASGNDLGKISPIVENQRVSLVKAGIEIDIFPIVGKGIKSYLLSVFKLRKYLQNSEYDLIHAHYSLSGFVSTFSGRQNIIVSLMGSDIPRNNFYKRVLNYFIRNKWLLTIVKSKEMASKLLPNPTQIIPNGVNLDLFSPALKSLSKKTLGLKTTEKYILFGSDPNRKEKNFDLVEKACREIQDSSIKLLFLRNISNELVPDYMNSAEVVVLPSSREGSPNIIKEAMACNRPIVATKVGDIEWLLDGIDGCFLSKAEPASIAKHLVKAIEFSTTYGNTNGREKIKLLELDSQSVAEKLFAIYQKTIEDTKKNN